MKEASGGDRIPTELFKILKVQLLECCTQYASKFRKLSNGHSPGKGQFSFQSQRRVMWKNVQTTTIKLSPFYITAMLCSKFCKLGFSSTWTEDFHIYKLDFKEAEEPEIKLPAFVGSWRKQGSFREISTSTLLTMPKPLTVWITTTWKNLKETEVWDHLICLISLYAGQEATVRTGHGTTGWFKIGKEVH